MSVKKSWRAVIGWPLIVCASALLFTGCSQPESDAEVITVYTARNEQLIKPLFDRFQAETGIEIRYITDNAGPLLARLKAEGKNTPADLFLTVDAGFLWQASEEGVLAPLDSPILKANIPASLRSSKDDWFGLSLRARTIIYATDRVQPGELSTYEALAEPEWNGRICLRTAKKVYNQSLVATMIKSLGEPETERIVGGWVKNLATPPYSNDIQSMEAVAAGQCDVTIVNTYYFGRLQKDNPDINLAVFWPNQSDRGVHINVSGAGLTKYAKNPAAARQLLEWLSEPEAQYLFAEANEEYPVNPAVEPSAEVKAWGDFKADNINVEAAGRLQAEAIKLMDRVGYQ
ncbi:extracellular solute-binding protein [Halioxenophilus sp. WMMB6]|uniref:extracellular solute-binding protein n=1 Tax=Halioxenophilus sp. WMMB6 TaxID=3073815 RepID=UPI00295F1490|nr:extracellular solute-binding protein [Halioxenophilus sp. WMMB6]